MFLLTTTSKEGPFLGIHYIGVYVRAPDFWKLPFEKDPIRGLVILLMKEILHDLLVLCYW